MPAGVGHEAALKRSRKQLRHPRAANPSKHQCVFMRSGPNMKLRLPSRLAAFAVGLLGSAAHASEADLVLPNLDVPFSTLGGLTGTSLLWIGVAVCVFGLMFGLAQYMSLKRLPVHR